MATELSDLVERAKTAVNAPGSEFIAADDTEWVAALAGAFWSARLRGFFTSWRVNDSEQIVPIGSETEDIAEELLQIIIVYTALNAIENTILQLPTAERYQAGPVETETRRSAQVLVELLKARRGELEDIRTELSGQNSSQVAVIDSFVARTAHLQTYCAGWLN